MHSSVHGSPALTHLQMVHPRFDLQPHLISSLQALAASGIVIHTGFQLLTSSVQPHPSGDDLLSKHHSDTQHILHAEVEHPKINNSIIIKLSSLLCICYSIPLLVVDAQESCSF